MMFRERISSILVKGHQARQNVQKEQQEVKKEAQAAVSSLTTALVDHLILGMALAYLNEKRLNSETKQLQLNVTNFAKHNTSWRHLIEGFNKSLKELGDVENWAKSIDGEMLVVRSTLEYSYKVNKEAAVSEKQYVSLSYCLL